MDDVFKALSDPTRRQLLDTLRDRGGLTLTELEQGLGMTRFGVMKHLKVLEDANLVLTRRDGRFKYHYLNALPIQEVADRWMAPYGKPLARFALNLKNALEERQTMAGKADYVMQTYIRTTQDALWDALINPDRTALYYYGARLKTDLRPGGPFQYIGADGGLMIDGEVVEVTPKTRIVSTFLAPLGGERQDDTRDIRDRAHRRALQIHADASRLRGVQRRRRQRLAHRGRRAEDPARNRQTTQHTADLVRPGDN